METNLCVEGVALKFIRIVMFFTLCTHLAAAQSYIDLVPNPSELESECEYRWAQKPQLLTPDIDSTAVDSLLLEWLGFDSPVSGSVVKSMVTCVYASSDNEEALSLLILVLQKDAQALVLYEYLTQSRWLAHRVELNGSIVFLAKEAPNTRDVCMRLLCNEVSDRTFEFESKDSYDRKKGEELKGMISNVLNQFWGRAQRRDGTRILPDDDLETATPLISMHDALRTLAIGNLSGNARRCGIAWEDTFLLFMRSERDRFWDEKQIAFFGMLHGIGQSMTFSLPGECGADEQADVSRSFNRYSEELKASRGRRVWPR
jgi:hypothetical protein